MRKLNIESNVAQRIVNELREKGSSSLMFGGLCVYVRAGTRDVRGELIACHPAIRDMHAGTLTRIARHYVAYAHASLNDVNPLFVHVDCEGDDDRVYDLHAYTLHA